MSSKLMYPTTPLLLTLALLGCRQEARQTAGVQEAKKDATALSAWADAPRQQIEGWVSASTRAGSPDFIPESDRIAVFDNDGTLWPEQPVPNQIAFMLDYFRSMSSEHPEWAKDPVLKAALDGDLNKLMENKAAGLKKVAALTHTGQSGEVFSQAVRQWIDTARHEHFGKLYKEVLYLPMLQLLQYLRQHGFKTFIVSGGGTDFMRVWSEEAYGIPTYQVIGSYTAVQYAVNEGRPTITKMAEDLFVDDKTGKPEAIYRFIGKVPVFCGGNSDGDQAMMQYTSGGRYKSMCLLLHHTDEVREFMYDKKTISGHLESALVEAKEKGWLVVDMKRDFKRMFPFSE